MCVFALQWWLDRCSEELLGEEAARCLCDEEERRKEAWRLQQQEDERLALALSQEFIHHQLVSRDVGGRGGRDGGLNYRYQYPTIHPN